MLIFEAIYTLRNVRLSPNADKALSMLEAALANKDLVLARTLLQALRSENDFTTPKYHCWTSTFRVDDPCYDGSSANDELCSSCYYQRPIGPKP